MTPQVGDQVAGYRLDELIGVGGSECPVFRATHLRLQQQVALKLLPKDRADDAFVRRFEREAQLAASLRDHPNVVAVYDFGDTDDLLYLAMRFVRGPDLGRLTTEGPLDLVRTCLILGQVAGALDAAHAAGLVHRDVKPGNIFVEQVDGADRAYIGDFGLTLPRDVTAMTRALWSGSPQYLAPERWEGSRPDPSVDVYALGCVAYTCLTGYPPYEGDSVDVLRFAHKYAPPPVLHAGHAKVPPAVDEVLSRAIAKEPGDRYPTCGEFITSLRAAAVTPGTETLPGPLGADTPAIDPPTPPTGFPIAPVATVPVPPHRNRWPVVALAGTLAVALAATLAVVLTGSGPVAGTPVARGAGETVVGPDLNALAVDADGDLYLALRDTSTIKKLSRDGRLTTVIGEEGEGFSGDGGPAADARLDFPHGLTVDPDGNLLIADTSNHRIRRIDPRGEITTIAGTGKEGAAGDGGPATRAEFDHPVDVAVGPRGVLFVAEAEGRRVRRIDPAGRITTVAGTGTEGVAGDGGPATKAELAFPLSIDTHGEDLYISDSDRIRRVAANGTITTVAGMTSDSYDDKNIGDGGRATAATLNTPEGVTVAEDGTLYIADRGASRVRRVTPDGLITTVAGTGTPGLSGDRGPGAQAQLAGPAAILAGENGDVYIADAENHRVRLLRDGKITTIAGSGPAYPGDGGPAADAYLDNPQMARRGPDGAVYIADADNNRIRRVDRDGTITTIAGTGRKGYAGDGGPATDADLSFPSGLDLAPDGTLYIADSGNDRVRAVDPEGTIRTVAGVGRSGSSADGGQADQSELASPSDLELDKAGNLYIAETDGSRIRRVDPDGVLTTVAGTGEAGYTGDGGPATKAQINVPYGIHVAEDGQLYISDYYNSRVRKVNRAGVISTVAGNGTDGYTGDGGPATQASLKGPYTVTTAADGTLYIADDSSHRVRKVDSSGVITTIAGTGTDGYPEDDTPANTARLSKPAGISADEDGFLLVVDRSNHQVYSIDAEGVLHLVAGTD